MSGPKRRLPVLKSAEDGDEEPRPPWHWVGFGAGAIFAAWVPLACVANAIEARLFSRFASSTTEEEIARAIGEAPPGDVLRLRIAVLLLSALPLVGAAFAGGFLVGRWGKPAGVREAALAGMVTALVSSAVACGMVGLSWTPLVGVVIAVPMAAWGGASGVRARARTGA